MGFNGAMLGLAVFLAVSYLCKDSHDFTSYKTRDFWYDNGCPDIETCSAKFNRVSMNDVREAIEKNKFKPAKKPSFGQNLYDRLKKSGLEKTIL